MSGAAPGQHPAMAHHDEHDRRDEELLEAQEGKGYGEDEGEREEALEPDDAASDDD